MASVYNPGPISCLTPNATIFYGGRFRSSNADDVVIRVLLYGGGSSIRGSDTWVGTRGEGSGTNVDIAGIPFVAVQGYTCSGPSLDLEMLVERVHNNNSPFYVAQPWMMIVFN